MPPGTGQLTILLIIITLAESGVLGDLLEGLSGQCDAARSGFEGDGCFVKFTERVNVPYSGNRGRWARSVKLSSPSEISAPNN